MRSRITILTIEKWLPKSLRALVVCTVVFIDQSIIREQYKFVMKVKIQLFQFAIDRL